MYAEYKAHCEGDGVQQQSQQQDSSIMASGYVTQSMAKNDDNVDPDYDLILDDDLNVNKFPKALIAAQKKPKKSLMAQNMTPELFEKLKGLKSAQGGWTIARAMNTGTCYPDSFVGCHAGDLESYHLYKELFFPVIEGYHKGYKCDDSMKHVTDMDVGKIKEDLTESAQTKIISTRIRCARNLSMFPLNPASTVEKRLEVADMMEKVFARIGDDPSNADLTGKFYRHSTMTKEETQALIDDHFLFRGKDKMQAASGYHRFWPVGRGIFCSKDKKFLLWINEGDHCRIISMQQGGDVKEVFSRLSRGVAAIENGLKKETGKDDVFSSDPILGMVTCCPSNLGTGMRGSVHLLVPKLIATIGFDKIDEIARANNCQARGSTGEHSAVVDRIDVSNWRRLGFPECELVQDMIKCVNMLAKMEDECPDPNFDLIMDEDLDENRWPKKLDEAKKKDKMSLMAQIMTPAMFEKFKGLKSDVGKWTIARAINTGVCHPSSFVGCHAGDLNSYEIYKELFYPVIEAYHVGYKTDGSMSHVTDMDPDKITEDLSETAKLKIISTRIRCARNLTMFPLNPASDAETRIKVADLMDQVFTDIPNTEFKELAGEFYRHTTMTKEEQQALIDDHFLFRGKDKMQAASGYHRFWPKGRGIFCSKDKKFLLWINEGDHCRIISMEKGGDVKAVFTRLSRGVKAIETGLQKITGKTDVFVSHPILGMVTCCPSNLGTGMRGSVHILVPKLIATIGFDKIDEIARANNCQARGSSGEHSEVVDRIDVSNWRRLGFPECELVQDMIKCANMLAKMEDECPDPNFDLIMDEDLDENRWPKKLDEAKKKDKMSLMAQIMTPAMFEKFKGLKSDVGKWTIARAINTGVCHPSSFVGCHAGDLNSYEIYKELFYPVIEAYHVGYKTDGSMSHVTDMDPDKITEDLSATAKSKIISTRIRCARNLTMFPLNPASDAETRIKVADLMDQVFTDIPNTEFKELAGTFFRHTTMTKEEQQALIDDHFLFRGKDKMQAASGYHRFWPQGRGIFCSKDKKFLLWINEGDHCRIISMEKGGDVKAVFTRLSRGVKAIETGLQKITGKTDVFVSHPILGMVTCCPSNLGTGMRGSVHILVPKLIKAKGFDYIDNMARENNCQARGSSGEHSAVVDRIDVSNWRRLGFKECDLVQDMIKFVNKLAIEEDNI